MQWLANISVRRPVFASVLVLTLLVIGAVGYGRLGVDKFPKVDFPMVLVTTQLPGAAPEEVESEVTDKIESAVNTVSGIDTLTSISSEGMSLVQVMFVLEKDGDVAAQEVRDRINTVLADLPEDAETPQVGKVDPDAAPVLLVAVRSQAPVRDVTEVADVLVRRRLESVSGVGQIRVIGGRKRQVNVRVDPLAMRAAGVTALEVERAIAAQNAMLPGGKIESGPSASTLRIQGRVSQPAELGDIVVAERGEHLVRLRDVATVEDGAAEVESAALKDGVPAVVLAVRKQSGANTVEVVDKLRAAITGLEPNLPAGFQLEVVRDNSETIRTSTHAVLEHLIVGAILAAVIVLVFLGSVRSTIIAAIAIPVSIIGTFSLMAGAGFTLNILTLLALALAVGIVIDDAIVVLENIHRWVDEKGMRPFPAAILATREIGMAVLATTLSLIAVFLPVAFMSGVVGRFLMSFGLTMAFAIAVSLLVSFTVTPMLAARWLRKKGSAGHGAAVRPAGKPILERVVDAGYMPLERLYVRVLRWVMRRRWVVVAASLASLAMVPVLMKHVPSGFLPVNDEAQFEIVVRTDEGSTVDATALLTERIARRTREVTGVKSTLVTVGDSEQKLANRARIFVRLVDPDQREAGQEAIMDQVRREVLPGLPEGTVASVELVPDIQTGGSNAFITYAIMGPDLDQLTAYGERALAELTAIPGIVDPDSNLPVPSPETQVTVDRARAADLGVNPADVAATLRLLVGGREVSTYQERGEQYDVHLRATESWRDRPELLSAITVRSARGGDVPLASVIKISDGKGPSQVNRLNRQRQVTLMANLAPGAGESDVTRVLEEKLNGLGMDPGYRYEPFGRSKEMARTGQAFAFAFLLSFVFMYLVLAAQFESWLHPLTILLALPLTLPFALLSLALFGQQLDIFSMLGLLVLFGVVKKNAILQIDHTNQLRANGRDRLEAILEGNRSRLRPILMTTFAFVAGMAPLLLATGIGSGFSRATAGIIVGGQTLSLLLTLLATPVFYSLFDDLAVWVKRRTARGDAAERDEESGRRELDRLVAEGEAQLGVH
jgi:HAE1 family hydrophobic/amphiphilic exporter-1